MRRSRGAQLRKRIWAARYLYLMFLPVFLYYVIFRYGPMLGLSIAFKDYNLFLGFEKSRWVGFKFFEQFFNSIYLWRLVRNTLLINLYDLVFNFPAAIVLALLLNEVQNRRFKKVTQTITYLPYFISSVVIASMVVQFLSPSSGIINNLIAAFGGERQYFMVQPESFRTIYTLMNLWKNIGWNSIIFLAAISGINGELYEACMVDGGGYLRRMWHITLPGIAGTIVVLLIMRLGHPAAAEQREPGDQRRHRHVCIPPRPEGRGIQLRDRCRHVPECDRFCHGHLCQLAEPALQRNEPVVKEERKWK